MVTEIASTNSSATATNNLVLRIKNFLLQAVTRAADVAAHVYVSVLLLNLPSVYKERAMALPQGCVMSALVTDWKRLGLISGVILSVVVTILQLQAPVNRIEVQTVGFACSSFAAIGFAFSSLLVLSFGVVSRLRNAMSSHSSGADNSVTNATVVDIEAQPINADHSWLTVLDRSGVSRSIWWNKYILMALPAVWVAWSGIAFVVFLLLFAWNTNTAMPTPTKRSELPGLVVTICWSIGGVYLTLTIRALQAPT